ncbi:MAG: hypothetical protein WBA65_14155 [Rhodanobacter sp.]|uniref:hypothetical protein n=1 Tax=Castellaniella sp. TaxID=1955812 RepID=UPI003C73B0C9
MILDTHIQGIPCRVRLTYHRKEDSPVLNGPMDWADPGSPEEVDFAVLDMQDKPAPHIEREMLPEDRAAIEQELIAAIHAEAEQVRADAAELAFNEWGAYA